jgi:hypothetical protein
VKLLGLPSRLVGRLLGVERRREAAIAATRAKLERAQLELYVEQRLLELNQVRFVPIDAQRMLRAFAFGGPVTIGTVAGAEVLEHGDPGREAFDRAVEIVAQTTPSRSQGGLAC